MDFLNQRLPLQVELGAQLHDDDDIEIVTSDGGFETRNARASQSLRQFDISFPAARAGDAVQEAVKALYKVARKSLRTWRFRDFTDYQLDGEVIGEGDGSTTSFQITQAWTIDGFTEGRAITRPVDPVQIFKNGALQSTGYAVDYDTGIVTFTAAPANGVKIAVTGEFDIPARFDSVRTVTALDGRLKHIETMTIKEVREL